MTPRRPARPVPARRRRSRDEAIECWLRETDEARLETLWAAADETRRRYVGDAVHLRGLVEVSNYCVRGCTYCGIRAGNRGVRALPRLRRTSSLDCARKAVEFGYGTLVMQSGEDYGITTEWMAGVLRRIRAETTISRDHAEPRRAPGRGPRRLARGRRRPLPAALRDLGRRALPAHPPRPARQGQRPHGHPAPPAGARLRGRHGHHGRHPRPDPRQHRRRHRAVPRHGHGHDRHRPLPAPPGDAAGAGVRAARWPTATGRRTRRPTASS